MLNQITAAHRVAIMGGTFDPIHNGHLAAAEAVRREFNIDLVVFMPTGEPPHKADSVSASAEHRFNMTLLAANDNPRFAVSRIETDRRGESYTIDTVRELRRVCAPDASIFIIIGADVLPQIADWKDASEIFPVCEFIAAARGGFSFEQAKADAAEISARSGAKIRLFEGPSLEISSTELRERIRNGRSVSYMLPRCAEKYIMKNRLYGGGAEKPESASINERLRTELTDEITAIKKRLKETLSEKRYVHTLGVAEASLALAERFGGDGEKCEIAALLHDCAKCHTDEEYIGLCREYGLETDEYVLRRPALAHAELGAQTASREYGIDDAEILNAVRNHTMGRAGMDLTSKIICLADFIEPNRPNYKGLAEARELAESDLDAALLRSLKETVLYNAEKGNEIHPRTLETIAWLENIEK